MSMSGVKIDDSVMDAFNAMKKDKKYNYCIFKIDGGKVIVDESDPKSPVDESKISIPEGEVGDDNDKKRQRAQEIEKEMERQEASTYDKFLSHMPPNDCRYALYDLPIKLEDGKRNPKLTFILWAPDNAPVKSKMVYASSKVSVKDKFKGVPVQVEATDFDELSRDAMFKKYDETKK